MYRYVCGCAYVYMYVYIGGQPKNLKEKNVEKMREMQNNVETRKNAEKCGKCAFSVFLMGIMLAIWIDPIPH